MTAIVDSARVKTPARRRPWLQPLFAAIAVAMVTSIAAGLAVTLARGRPLPWQLHMPWVGPHILAAFLVLGLGAAQLALPKGDRRHRIMGWAWCVLMAFIAVSGLLIQLEPGHVTTIHIASSGFAVADLILLPVIVWSARTRRRRLHKGAVLGLFACLLNAGLLAFIPFRAVGLLVFGLFH